MLAFATLPVALNSVLGQALVSRGQLRLRLVADWALALVLSVASWALASRGALGLALASAAAYLVVVLVLTWGQRRSAVGA